MELRGTLKTFSQERISRGDYLMETELLEIGAKIELKSKYIGLAEAEKEHKVYVSQILDIKDSETIVAAMPIQEGHVIPLEVGTILDAYFYTQKGIFQAQINVLSRGKERNIHIMEISLETPLTKFQRRQFYRLDCSIPLEIAILQDEEIKKYFDSGIEPEQLDEYYVDAVIKDISGGGLRVISEQDYSFQNEMNVFLRFPLPFSTGMEWFFVMGKIINIEKKKTYFDVRIVFEHISNESREKIVKYIFEEQRRLRQKERG
jgi:c-di-GMP-binding flagellar brake protein YcgR